MRQHDLCDLSTNVPKNDTRKVRRAIIHPLYKRHGNKLVVNSIKCFVLENKIVGPNGQPIFDFALIEIKNYKYKYKNKDTDKEEELNFALNPWDKKNRPVCLPPQRWWNEGFVGNAAVVTGYGRIEEEFVEGKLKLISRKKK